MKTILQITLILLLIVLAVELVFPSAIIIGFALTKASPCPRTQVFRGIQARLRFTKTLGAYRSSEAVFKQIETDHRGFALWQTPEGSYWIPTGSDQVLPVLLAQQAINIYGTGELGVRTGDIVLD